MKNLFAVIISLVVISSCSPTREAGSAKGDSHKEKKLVEQTAIRNAVESKRYIIKFDRIYNNFGGMIELIPRANYLIIDRGKAILNTAYVGRQYDIRPIAAIDIHGKALNYAVTNNLSKGSYEIKMKVGNGRSNTFDVYITITKNGYCSASVSSLKIDNIRYSGYLVPIDDNSDTLQQSGNSI
jgi:hypothetical protein